MRKQSSDPIFHAALLVSQRKHGYGFQKWLADAAGISPAYVCSMIKGRRYGEEDTRREIAKALGYTEYESFLDIGRRELNLPTMADQRAPPSVPEPSVSPFGSVEELTAKCRAVLESGDIGLAVALAANVIQFHETLRLKEEHREIVGRKDRHIEALKKALDDIRAKECCAVPELSWGEEGT